MRQIDLAWYTFSMEKNEIAAPELFPCDSDHDATTDAQATDDGRAILCDECREEYNAERKAEGPTETITIQCPGPHAM